MTSLALGQLILFLAVGGDISDKPAADGSCGKHGTAIDFYETPSKAATEAKKSGKLVMVLHVSGYFEDPRFT
ncbi:MAG: hypothetical protein EBV06_10945 [Planctomycetia bacterium]|nr:hypothetical protein [Planctomycetia bacterium]